MKLRVVVSLSALALLPHACPAQEPFVTSHQSIERRSTQVEPQPGPPALRLVIVAVDEPSSRLRPLVAEMAGLEGFEVLPQEMSVQADVHLYLRASGSDAPLALAGKSAGQAAAAFQRSAPGSRMAVCDSCLPGGASALYLDIGRAASTPAQQMDAALSVRDALRTLSSPGPRTAQKGEI
ncbi:MAG: hypothetical protein ACUVS7_04135, partial [Bryobacteraceae bacterium]